jgi:hypothetical protein
MSTYDFYLWKTNGDTGKKKLITKISTVRASEIEICKYHNCFLHRSGSHLSFYCERVAFPLAVSNKVFTALRLKSTVWQAFLQKKL